MVKGTLIGESGYTKIASTSEIPVVSATLEDKHGQNLLSPNFASLFAFRTENAKSLSIVHIQGQHNGVQGRMYDTRIFYNIEIGDIRKTDTKLGAILGSLPKMKQYEEKEIGSLSDNLQIKDIQGFEKDKVDNLCEYILQAIVEGKYLLIKLDEGADWKENKVLENAVSKTLFAAIDKLPEKLRPAVSFALSVDDKYKKEFLENFLVILYHGDNNFGFKSTIPLDWEDLKNKTKTNYATQSKVLSNIISSVLKEKLDFYDTNFSSNDMALDIYDVCKLFLPKPKYPSIDECKTDAERKIMISVREVQLKEGSQQEKINALKDLLKTQHYSEQQKYEQVENLPQDIFTNSEIRPLIEKLLRTDLNAKNNVDLSDIYKRYKYFNKENIAENYAKTYFDKKISTNKISQQIEIVENTISQISDKFLSKALEKVIVQHIVSQNLSADDWCKIVGLECFGSYETEIKQKTIKRDVSFYKELLKNKKSKHNELAFSYFTETATYKNNSDDLCFEPFLSYLSADKKQELRKTRVKELAKFKELFAGITYEEINDLPVNFRHKIELLSKDDKSKFIQDNREECETQFENDFLNSSDIKNSVIYNLYKDAKEDFPKINDTKVTEINLSNAFNNAKTLEINLSRRIIELYKLNSTVTAWRTIYEITKQKPAENEKTEKTVDTTQELDDCIILKKAGFILPEIEVEKLIRTIIPQKSDNLNMEDLLSKLKQLGISYKEYKNEIEKRLTTKDKNKNKELLEKYFDKEIINIVVKGGNEEKPKNSDDTDKSNKIVKPNIFKKGFGFVKTNPILSCIIIVCLIVVIIIVNLLSPKEEEKTQEKKVKNTVIQDDTTQSEVYETPVTNDTIYIYYEECPRNANKQYIRNGKKDILKLDVFDRVTDSIRLFNLNPIAIDSIVYRDITITQIKDKPKFTLNGPTTTGELLQEIKSMVEN